MRKKINLRYSFRDIEEKWSDFEQNFTNHSKKTKKTMYILEMFPYPSGKIHVGHIRNYTIGEILRRFYFLKGFDVFRPMGWDAFGLPAENAAIENNSDPAIWTYNNIENMKKTLQKVGFWYDWSHELATCNPSYYKHQQEIFIKMYEKGLVSRKKEWVNWDPHPEKGMTVLANEQVDENGRSWRSGAIVEKKQIDQWFLNISHYAEELLQDLDLLEGKWPEKVITMQKNWIGKSHGFIIKFPYENSFLEVFTTTPEVVFGCTFLTISPESKKAIEINEKITMEYLNTPENQRKPVILDYCQNHYTGEKIPIFIADYVLGSYGTGIVMGVPLYDERDQKFAKELHLKEILLFDNDGKMINSGFLNGLDKSAAREEISKTLEKKTLYKLRDWCLSRQRYWGCPIPFIHCPKCGVIPETRGPVELPLGINIKVQGNPLSHVSDFINTTCPKCGIHAKRETDTMDTFVDSSWYMLRFPCVENDKNALDDKVREIDYYLGGIEHAILHLLYARFFTKALRDLGYIKMTEPFNKLVTQGMVCHVSYQGKKTRNYYYPEDVEEIDGVFYANGEEVMVGSSKKMSKSEKNVVDPLKIIDSFGTDTLKMFVISDSPVEKDFDWNINALFGCHRFLQAVWKFICNMDDNYDFHDLNIRKEIESKVNFHLFEMNKFLSKIQLNLFIAQIRTFFKYLENEKMNGNEALFVLRHFLRCFWIVCPAISSEIYEKVFGQNIIESEQWVDGKPLEELSMKTIVIQINGHKKHIFETELSTEEEITQAAQSIVKIANFKRKIYVPGKIINFIV